MLIKIKFQFPEIVIGILFSVALFAMGVVFESSYHPVPPSNEITATEHREGAAEAKNNPNSEGHWLTRDAAGFFTFLLVLVGSGQLAWIWIQASLFRESMVRTQRAFVFVKGIFIEPSHILKPTTYVNQFTQEITGWKIGVQLENSGETPTQYMFNHISSETFDAEITETFEFPDRGDLTRVPNLIGPRAIDHDKRSQDRKNQPRPVSALRWVLFVHGLGRYSLRGFPIL